MVVSDDGGTKDVCEVCEFMNKLEGDCDRELDGAIDGAARKLDDSPLN